MQNKENKLWTVVRLMLYLMVVIAVVLCVNGKVYLKCVFLEKFGFICPTCGATRATLSILKGEVLAAIDYNAFYTLVIFPFTVILVLEDVYTVIKRVIFKTSNVSLIEVLFGGNV